MSNVSVLASPANRTGAYIVSAFLATGLASSPAAAHDPHLVQNAYVPIENARTIGAGNVSVLTAVDPSFEVAIADFYEKFLRRQEPLGQEFEAVLSQNLWDLYAS